MEKIMRAYMLKAAKKFASAHSLSMATVSRRFHGTDTFFDDFQAGKVSITLRKWDQIMQRFSEVWPEGMRQAQEAFIKTLLKKT